MYDENDCKISLSIEKKLEKYAYCKGTTERHAILWHAWSHNKYWLKELLQWVVTSYPNYSKHDESHVLSVLHNIEMILGEKEIEKLSASDCFLILHSVYLHDIGMCITYAERNTLMQSEAFVDFLQRSEKSSDKDIAGYAKLLLTLCKDIPSDQESLQESLNRKLEIYYAIMYLVSTYERKEHAERSKERITEWISEPGKLGIGFSTSGIPSRFFYTIAACAGIHNSSNFDDVLNLPQEDTGYVHDYMHPRFAAVLLQLGDSLDLDNDRFQPLVKEFLGELPLESQIHEGKHQSIRRLRISPSKITIRADCKNPNVLRLVYNECEAIKKILKNATFYWSVICPKELSAVLPSFDVPRLYLNGKLIDERLVKAKFEISQNKAFNLLQGKNLYKDSPFVFLREIIQNAIDASKIQYFQNWEGSIWKEDLPEKESIKNDIYEYGSRQKMDEFPVEIDLYIACTEKNQKNGETEYRKLDTAAAAEKFLTEGAEREFGVLVTVRDHGTGIPAEDILKIAEVGSSFESKRKALKDMPQWMQPTAEFGIGLQSIFLVADSFCAYTHCRNNEEYKVQFSATGDKGDSCINVMPKSDVIKGFGTLFEIFVPIEHKIKHKKDIISWRGDDPFGKDYKKYRSVRHARELMIQLVLYVEKLIGEKLFPINLRLHDFDTKNLEVYKEIADTMKKLALTVFIDDEKKEKEKAAVKQTRTSLTWMYDRDKQTSFLLDNEVYTYFFDTTRAKLYIYDKNTDTCARFGADRLFEMRSQIRNAETDLPAAKMKLFYKGIVIENQDYEFQSCFQDMSLLEYIDIKGKLERDYLALNRSVFTEEGCQYIEKHLYPRILRAAHAALREMDEKNKVAELSGKLENIANNPETSEVSIHDYLIALCGFAVFAQISEPDEERSASNSGWNLLLESVSDLIEEKKKGTEKGKVDTEWRTSTFYNMDVYERNDMEGMTGLNYVNAKRNIAYILNTKNKYVIISKRNSVKAAWTEKIYCLEDEKIQLEDGTEINIDIRKKLAELQIERDSEKRNNLIREIDNFGESIISRYTSEISVGTRLDFEYHYSEMNAILSWMLKNIPTLAMFTSLDNKTRIYVTDCHYNGTMYMNGNSQVCIFEKVMKNPKLKKIQRFSVIPNTGYHTISLCEDYPSIYPVKVGRFSTIGLKTMICPFSREELQKIWEETEKFNPGLADGFGERQIKYLKTLQANIINTFEDIRTLENLDEWEKVLVSEYDSDSDNGEKLLKKCVETILSVGTSYSQTQGGNQENDFIDNKSLLKQLVENGAINEELKIWCKNTYDCIICVRDMKNASDTWHKNMLNKIEKLDEALSAKENELDFIDVETYRELLEFVCRVGNNGLPYQKIHRFYKNVMREFVDAVYRNAQAQIEEESKKLSNFMDSL